MVYQFAIGFAFALLLANSNTSYLLGINLLSKLYTGFPAGVEGVRCYCCE